MAETEEEKLRKKINRFKSMAGAMGIPAEEISAFVGGMQGTAGGGTTGSKETTGLVSPEETYGVEKVGGAVSERDRTVSLVALRRDLNSWNYKTFKDLVGRYAGRLPTQEIMQEYNAFHSKPGTWGQFKEPEEEVRGWAGEAIAKEKGTSASVEDTQKEAAIQRLVDQGWDEAEARALYGF